LPSGVFFLPFFLTSHLPLPSHNLHFFLINGTFLHNPTPPFTPVLIIVVPPPLPMNVPSLLVCLFSTVSFVISSKKGFVGFDFILLRRVGISPSLFLSLHAPSPGPPSLTPSTFRAQPVLFLGPILPLIDTFSLPPSNYTPSLEGIFPPSLTVPELYLWTPLP